MVAGVVWREALRAQLLPQGEDGIHVTYRVASIHNRRKQRHLVARNEAEQVRVGRRAFSQSCRLMMYSCLVRASLDSMHYVLQNIFTRC